MAACKIIYSNRTSKTQLISNLQRSEAYDCLVDYLNSMYPVMCSENNSFRENGRWQILSCDDPRRHDWAVDVISKDAFIDRIDDKGEYTITVAETTYCISTIKKLSQETQNPS